MVRTVKVSNFNELVAVCEVAVRRTHNSSQKTEDLLRYGYLDVPDGCVQEWTYDGWQVVAKKENVDCFIAAYGEVSKAWNRANGVASEVVPSLIVVPD